MASFSIHITATGDVLSALDAAITAAKALQLEYISVDCGNGIKVLASCDSRVVDLFNIYQLEYKLKRLESKTS